MRDLLLLLLWTALLCGGAVIAFFPRNHKRKK